MKIQVNSEIGVLEGVILHSPGNEIENMTPENAERSLYSDILNLSVASKEYSQFEGALSKVAKTFQVRDLLSDVLNNIEVKKTLIQQICHNENVKDIADYLMEMESKALTKLLIDGVEMNKNTLTHFLDDNRYALPPLPNFFFTRDASVSINDNVLICRMARRVRERESIIMESIFNHHPELETNTLHPFNRDYSQMIETMEGGDVLIAREDVLLIGMGTRTTSQGIDKLIDTYKGTKRHIIVQELPHSPESFIHLDMVFTFLDVDKCMVYEPLILKNNKYRTIHIEIDGDKTNISIEKNMIEALKKLNFDLKPIICGGTNPYVQEREQWHSGANFFALGPGRVIGYERNIHTINELNNNGFEVLKAKEIIEKNINPNDYDKYVITIEGSELSRGGGGCRCMSMPIRRKAL